MGISCAYRDVVMRIRIPVRMRVLTRARNAEARIRNAETRMRNLTRIRNLSGIRNAKPRIGKISGRLFGLSKDPHPLGQARNPDIRRMEEVADMGDELGSTRVIVRANPI